MNKEIYPLKLLQIETTNLCNANCKFCIHSSLKNFGTMSDKLFLKIISDAAQIDTIKTIVPMLLGEPLLDKKIIPRLKLINQMLPEKKIYLFTNCSLLTPKIIKQLSNIDNIVINFSLNGTNKQTRQKLMGLGDFEHCKEMIGLYVKTQKPYLVTLVHHPSVSDREIKEFKKNSKWRTSVITYQNWSGDKFEGVRQTHCHRAISQMTIMQDGKVNLCCMEYGKVIFGDVNTSSVKEIWESKYRQMYCDAHAKGKYLKGVCANCTRG